MDVKGGRESKNFEDHTLGNWVRTRQGSDLLNSLLLQNDVTHGAPEGYENWFNDRIRSLSPQDIYIMKQHGLAIEDMMKLRALKEKRFPINVDAFPYSESYADNYLKNLHNHR